MESATRDSSETILTLNMQQNRDAPVLSTNFSWKLKKRPKNFV